MVKPKNPPKGKKPQGKGSKSPQKPQKVKVEELRKQHTFIGKIKRKLEVRKKRRQQKKKKYAVTEVEQKVSEVKSEEKKEKDVQMKFYWARALTGVITAILGGLAFKLIGWDMFIFMIVFLVVWPYILSFAIFRIPYVKKKWDWKKIISKGFAAHFFLFLLITTLIHTYNIRDIYNDRFDNPADTQQTIIQDE